MKALCSVCQTLIQDGARWSEPYEDWILYEHPAAGVLLDLNESSWKGQFDPSIHRICEGSGLSAERVIQAEKKPLL